MKHITKKHLAFFLYLFCWHLPGYTQEVETAPPAPFLIDQAALSGLDLKKIDLKNEPERDFFQKNLYRGPQLSVYVVSSQSWPGKMNNFPIDEFIYMLHGEARVQAQGQVAQTFRSREFFVAPKGFTGSWEIKAGDHYHYELSVITTHRADSTQHSPWTSPLRIPAETLSGTQIKLNESGTYSEILADGVEMRVSLQAQAALSTPMENTPKDQMIHVLSGQLSLSGPKKEPILFNTGDFFVIPAGYTGTWESRGHGLCKYILVESKL